jgi:hypothetical protein
MADGAKDVVLRDDVIDLFDSDDLGLLQGLDCDVVA